MADQKSQVKKQMREEALAKEDERMRMAQQRETVYGMQAVNEAERERLEASLIKAMANASTESSESRGGGSRLLEEDMLGDMFGDFIAKDEPKKAPAKPAAEAKDSVASGGPLTAAQLKAKAELQQQMDMGKAAEMETLTALAYQRREEARLKAEAKATEVEAKKKAKAAARDAALVALQAKRGEVATKAQEGLASARASLAEAAAGGSLDATLEENSATQADELMVIQSIFGEEDCTVVEPLVDGSSAAVRLNVRATVAKQERLVVLNLEFPPEYPSHLPPCCRVLEGVAAAESGFFIDSLHALFYDTLGEMVVHVWCEWIKEEWLPLQAAPPQQLDLGPSEI